MLALVIFYSSKSARVLCTRICKAKIKYAAGIKKARPWLKAPQRRLSFGALLTTAVPLVCNFK